MEQTFLLIILLVAGYGTAQAKEEHVIISNDNSIFYGYSDYGKVVDFGLFGADQVTMNIQNLRKVAKYNQILKMDLELTTMNGGRRVSSTSRKFTLATKGRIDFNGTAMVNIPGGTFRVQIRLPTGLEASNVKQIDFNLKQLDTRNYYSLTSHSNNGLDLAINTPNLGNPFLYQSTCAGRQMFQFQESNYSRQFKIFDMSGYPNFLLVEDTARSVGSAIFSGPERWNPMIGFSATLWHLESVTGGSVKIRSNLTGTCMSSINGFGGKIVLDDCENANMEDISWKIKFCEG